MTYGTYVRQPTSSPRPHGMTCRTSGGLLLALERLQSRSALTADVSVSAGWSQSSHVDRDGDQVEVERLVQRPCGSMEPVPARPQ